MEYDPVAGNVLPPERHRRWYRTTTWIDFCCFHLQLNQYLTAFLQSHKHKERTASGGIYGQRLCSHVRPKRPWPTNETTAMPIHLRIDKNLCQYAYEYDPVAGITLPPEQPRRWYRTTTYTDNDRADIHTIHQPTDRADTHTIYNRPNNRANTPTIQ